jgi:hypothetical protein
VFLFFTLQSHYLTAVFGKPFAAVFSAQRNSD